MILILHLSSYKLEFLKEGHSHKIKRKDYNKAA